MQESARNDGIRFGQHRTLRRRAEDRIRAGGTHEAPRNSPEPGESPPGDTARLIQELQIHKIELEMQNEELKRASRELEASRSWYMELYDFAPVAYLTIGEDGTVLEANLAASILLGVGRADLIRSPFSRYVSPEDREALLRRRKDLVDSEEPCSDDFLLLRARGAPFWANLKAAASRTGDGMSVVRLVVSDIDDRKKAGQERELLISELQAALRKVKLLGGLLPICSWCKKIRDDQGYWNAIEHYLSQHSDAEFTHGICPECNSRYHGGIVNDNTGAETPGK